MHKDLHVYVEATGRFLGFDRSVDAVDSAKHSSFGLCVASKKVCAPAIGTMYATVDS